MIKNFKVVFNTDIIERFSKMSELDLMYRMGILDIVEEGLAYDRYGGEAPIEDVYNELGIVRQNRNAFGTADLRHSNSFRRKPPKSKSVQTEPDTSGLPPPWRIIGQSLVDELYNGLGNAMNSVYHSSCRNEDKMKIQGRGNIASENMKYFTYENGYYKSKLIPNVRVPGVNDEDRQLQLLHSETFKKSLKRLMTVATKLRNLVSYLDNGFDEQAECSTNNEIIFVDKCQQTEIKETISECMVKNQDTLISDGSVQSGTVADKCQQTDLEWTIPLLERSKSFQNRSENYVSCSGVLEMFSDVDSLPTTGVKSSDCTEKSKRTKESEWMNEEFRKEENGGNLPKTGLTARSDDSILPDVQISKCRKHQEIHTSMRKGLHFNENEKKTVSSTKGDLGLRTNLEQQKVTAELKMNDENSKHSTDQRNVPDSYSHAMPNATNNKIRLCPGPSYGKSVTGGKKNPCHSNQTHYKQSNAEASGSTCKNFIRRNILASKLGTNRTSANNVKQEATNGSTFGETRCQNGKITRL